MWVGVCLGARTLLGPPGLTTRSKKLLGAKGIATRSKDATRGVCFFLPSTDMGPGRVELNTLLQAELIE